MWLLQYVMKQSRKAGVTSRGGVRVAPAVVKSSERKVELSDCVDGTKWVQIKSGGSSEGLSGGRHRAEATVVLTSGKWKVSELYWGEVGSCME
ncbi:hypothetical protein [Streptomyces sp. NPDC058441]|uniref:hypothetical protein n=1 Tax=Streptomyces sp. NPDC058441 TaxID=3346502 RepID=UPI00364A86FD